MIVLNSNDLIIIINATVFLFGWKFVRKYLQNGLKDHDEIEEHICLIRHEWHGLVINKLFRYVGNYPERFL